MRMAFYKADGEYYDKVVRNVTRSPYSHVELVINNISYSSSLRDGGVRKKIINFNPNSWDFIEISGDGMLALQRFSAEEGKPYDLLGAFRAGVSAIHPQARYLIPNPTNRLFCSELVGKMLDTPDYDFCSPGSLFRHYSLKNTKE